MVNPVKLHEISISVRWGDMDAAGVINNAIYFRYVEDVRVSWFQKIGYTLDMRETGPVLVNASMDFLLAVSFPCNLIVRMFAEPPGRSSVKTHYELCCSDTGRIMAKGSAVVVWVNFSEKKSVPIPKLILSHLVK